MRRLTSIIGVTLVIGLLAVLNYVYFTGKDTGISHMVVSCMLPFQETKPQEEIKDFAYYTQTSICAPAGLLLNSCLGNSTILDLYVLSYAKKCEAVTHPHIHYIFINKSLTWTQGRNELYYHVRGLGKQYRYHIFLDDDVRLLRTSDMTDFAQRYKVPEASSEFNNLFFSKEDGFKNLSAPKSSMSPWRLFENYLLEYSPAYANVNYCSRTIGAQGIKDQGEIYKTMCGSSPMPDVTVMFIYDAFFIAFHDKALDILFPMYEGFDKDSWWISAQIQFHTARILLRGSGITVWKASVFNLAHAKYPRGGKMTMERWKTFLEKDGQQIGKLTRPEKDFIKSFDDNAYFSEYAVCGTPIKFPVHEHYSALYHSSQQPR